MGKPIEGNNTNYTLGRPEWQQKWETKYQEFYTEKDLHNNREILNKPYLKPNYSEFEYVHFPNKEPFLTSNQRDFKPIYMTDKDRAVLDEKTKNFIRNSKIILGTSPPTKETNYMEVMKDPKDHFASITMIKYNSNMINIIYIPSLNSLFLRTLITPGDLTAIIEIRIEKHRESKHELYQHELSKGMGSDY